MLTPEEDIFSVFKGRFTNRANFCGCASETDKLEIFFYSDIHPRFFSFADFFQSAHYS